ncbi:MAG: phosphoglycerate mutase, partial [Candidatus Scalindua rubra]
YEGWYYGTSPMGLHFMANDKTTTLYLLRHGQTEDNVRRIIQGQNDSPLTREGITATRDRAKKLKGIAFDAIFCSNLERARKSLEILLEELDSNIDVNYCTEIRELDFGQFTGKNIEDVKEIILLHKKQTWKHYPDGESGDSFSKRIIDFVENVLRRYEGKAVLFMTHYGVIETILKHYVKKPDKRLNTRNYDTGVLYFNNKDVSFKWI